MRLVAFDQLSDELAETIVVTNRYVMKFIHCNKAIVKGLNTKLFKCKTERGVSTYQQAIFRSQKRPSASTFHRLYQVRCKGSIGERQSSR